MNRLSTSMAEKVANICSFFCEIRTLHIFLSQSIGRPLSLVFSFAVLRKGPSFEISFAAESHASSVSEPFG